MPPAGSGHRVARAAGIARSLLTYYGPVWRRRRIVNLYGAFLGPGDLAFDIGAHVGNRVRTFRRLGARVVAVEPQPDFVRILRRLYGRDSGVVIEPAGVAAAPGRAALHLSTRTPTVSTLDLGWSAAVGADPSFRRVRWDRSVEVPLTTLDELVGRHGEPRFCKIDVEGYEAEVLRGLSRPVAGLSFEHVPAAAERALACVERLGELGDYRYRFSPAESLRFAHPTWLPPAAMAELLRAGSLHRSGDVFAVRRPHSH